MDNVNIEIQSSSEKATSDVSQLIETLGSLNSALSNVQKNINKYVQGMGKIGNIGKKIKVPKISTQSNKTQTQKEADLLNSNTPPNNKKLNNKKGEGEEELKGVQLLQKRLESLNGTINKITQRIGNMFKSLAQSKIVSIGLKGLDATFGNLGRRISDTKNRLASTLKSFSKYALALYGIRSAFYAVRNTTNEFLSSQNAVAQQLSANISYLKYALGASLAPVITFLTNLIYSLLKAIQYVVYYFARINIFAKASAKSMASGAGSAGKARKELQKQLQAFDELNNISLQNNAGSGGGGGGGGIAPDMDLSKIDEKFKYLFDDIENWGKNLAETINNALSKINWSPILDGAEKASLMLAKIMNDFTFYLDFKLLGTTIAQGINTAIIFVNTFYQNYKWDVLGTQLANGLNSMVDTIQWDVLGQYLTDKFRALILTLEGFVTTFHWSTLGKNVGEMMKNAFNNIPWDNLAVTINKGITGILDTLINILDTIPWDEVGTKIGKLLNDINWGEIISKLFQVIIKVGQGLLSMLWNGIFSGSDTMIIAGLVASFASLKLSITGLLGITNLAIKFKDFIDIAGGIQKIIPIIQAVGKALGGITLVVTGVATAVTTFIDMWNNGVTVLKAALSALGVVVAALGAILLGVSAPVAAIVAGVVVLVGAIALLTKAYVTNKAEIKSVKQAQEDYNKAIEDAAEKEQTYEDAIDKATDTLERLEEAERSTGLSGQALYEQVENGTLTYANMTQQQREVYKAYKDNETAQNEAAIATNAFNEAKKEEVRQSFENQLALAKESKNYDNFKKSVVDAFEKGEISADEARTLIERSMTDMSGASQKTFTEDLPDDLKEGLDPMKYASASQKVGKAIIDKFDEWKAKFNVMKQWWDEKVAPWFTREKWQDIATKAKDGIVRKFNEWKASFQPIKDWWNEKIAPWFTVAKWKELAQKGVDGIKSAFSNLNIKLKMPHFSWGTQPAGGTVAKILSALNLPTNLPKLSVKWYAQGGFPTEGDLFFANEAGPEMVGSIGNKNAVANNDQITRAIAQATYQAISQALNENQDNGQPIIVNVGNETLYKGIVRSRSQASNQYGITV